MQLQGTRYFTSLDMQNGYWQMPLDKDSIPKTAFSSRYGQYEWRVMPQGLTNAPASFQRAMNNILSPFLDKFCMVYLDDILMYSRTEIEHKKHVKTVLRALDEAKLILNLEKYRFGQQSIRFLGHIISAEGIQMQFCANLYATFCGGLYTNFIWVYCVGYPKSFKNGNSPVLS